MPKFKLKSKVEKLDDVAEPYRAAYVEKDGKFSLDPEKLEGIEFDDKAELASVVKKERDARTKAEQETKRFDRLKPLLEDEEELGQFLEAWEKRGEAGGNGNGGKPDASKELELKDKLHAKELKKLNDQLIQLQASHDKSQTELKEFRLWTPLREVATKAGLLAEDWELARLDLSSKNQFGFDEENRLVVMEDGHPSSIAPEKFFKEVYPDQRPKFYRASGAAGSGASNGSGGTANGRKTITRTAFDQLTLPERDARIKDGTAVVDG